MKEKPVVYVAENNGRYWTQTFESFQIKVYVPNYEVPADVVNYGFMAPYFLVLEEKSCSIEESISFAKKSGLEEITKGFGGSVCFVYPTAEGGWKNAPASLFTDIIEETRISQFYEDGVAIMYNRFTGEWEDKYIRGGLHRSILFGFRESADYIALNCLKTQEGQGLYGRGDVTPTVCVLEELSVMPEIERRDIPVVSVKNSDEANQKFQDNLDYVLIQEEADYKKGYEEFFGSFRRMVGHLQLEDDLEKMGMVREPGVLKVNYSPENIHKKEQTSYDMGYVAYYNKGLLDNGPVPLVLCFHGGGDSAMCMVSLSGWNKVAAEHNFLLVSVENHTSSTATEAMELLDYLLEKYPIDTQRIYATGFSMGGVKSWDMFQEYPKRFAAVAPMDATYDVGFNIFGREVTKPVNRDTILPVFYVGGEDTPLPELSFQEAKCLNRMAYVLQVNKAKRQNRMKFEEQDKWENPIWGINGDEITQDKDEQTGSVLTMHHFISEDNVCYSVFASASKQAHEMRHLNCENAWKFMSRFTRVGSEVNSSLE